MINQNQLLVKHSKFNLNLETLRGVAAIMVIWGHSTIAHGWIDTGYYPTGIWSYAGPGHLSVLVFFMLSGYVIGVAHISPLTLATVPGYLKKRFVRIYPIYLLCFILALLVSVQQYSIPVIINHLLMTQGLSFPVIQAISPSWSLVYEVVFYLMFIPISIFRINPMPVALLSMLTGCIIAYLYPNYGLPLLPSYAFGFAFWLIGLTFATHVNNREPNFDYAWMVSCLFLLMSIGKLDAPVTLFHQISLRIVGKDLSLLPNEQPGVIAYRDFGYLPYCLIILSVFIGKKFTYQRLIMAILLLLPVATFYYYYKHLPVKDWLSLLLPTIFYFLSFIFFFAKNSIARLSKLIIDALVVTGGVSYGLYIIHFPILYVFGHTSTFTGTALSFVIRLAAFLFLCISGAYLLEKKFQPWIKAKLL